MNNAMTVEEAILKIKACEEEIGKGIIGQTQVIRQVILALLAEGNVLLEGVPGLGKTQLVKTLSKALSVSFSRIQFTPDLMPADVTGTNLIVEEDGKNIFQFQQGPIFAQIVLADEINRATPKTQSALLEAMQEKTVTVGRNTYTLPEPFMVMATQNPIENEGTYPLPEAQLDRFIFKLLVDFPTKEELLQIINITVNNDEVIVNPVLTGEELIQIRTLIKDMPIAKPVMDYALNIVVGTHSNRPQASSMIKKYVSIGASPRAAQAIIKTAKAKALLEGRYNVSFEDIEFCSYPALRHRMITNFEALSDRVDSDMIIRNLLMETTK